MFDVEQALRELVEKGGSDLHLKAGSAPLFRVNGSLAIDEGAPQLGAEDTEGALHQVLSDEDKLREFAAEYEVDFSFEIEGVARFRINAFRQRGLVSMACRAIPHKISTIQELALPPVVTELAEEERGIVLLTGTTGSGKSTTLAAMIDHMNSAMSKHIVTIEDPIEFGHDQGRHLPAPRTGRRRRTRGRLRDPADDRPGARHDHRSGPDGQAAGGDRLGRLLRHADLRPGPLRAREGRARDLRGRDGRGL